MAIIWRNLFSSIMIMDLKVAGFYTEVEGIPILNSLNPNIEIST